MSQLTEQRKIQILWALFLFVIAYAGPRTIGLALGWNPQWLSLTDLIDFILPIFFLVLLCLWMLGPGRATIFLALAFLISAAFEVAGLQGAGVFGGPYAYQSIWPQLLGLPFIIPVYWTGIIFLSYSLVSSFLVWAGQPKPAKGGSTAGLLPVLIVLDGLFVTAVDISLDPICLEAGIWAWEHPGPFFGVPSGNFIGWFVVAVLAAGSFRIFEYFRPAKNPVINTSFAVIPVLAFGFIGIGFVLEALIFDLPHIAILPLVTILPAVLINLSLYLLHQHRGMKN